MRSHLYTSTAQHVLLLSGLLLISDAVKQDWIAGPWVIQEHLVRADLFGLVKMEGATKPSHEDAVKHAIAFMNQAGGLPERDYERMHTLLADAKLWWPE